MNFLRNLIQGSHSASRADSEQKKKGGVPPPGSADPPSKLEEEANVQRVTTEPVSENRNGASPPSSPRSTLSDVSPQSVIKDCETPSTTEDNSFASCLTEEPNSLSENLPVPTAKDLSTTNAVVKGLSGLIKNPESSINSVSDSVALNNTHNGVNKDSEYESAEEIDLPQDPTFVVTRQPFSEKSLPAPPVTDQIHSLEETVTPCSEEIPHLENSIKENSITSPSVGSESECIEAERFIGEQSNSDAGDAPSAISESLVTVTKNETIEDTISKKTFVQQEVTEVIQNHTVLSGQVNASSVEVDKELSLERQDCAESKITNNNETFSKAEQFEENFIVSSESDTGKTHQNQEEVKADTAILPSSIEHTENFVNEQISAVQDKPISHCVNTRENGAEEPIQKEESQVAPVQQIQPTESKETPVEHIVPAQQIQPTESKETPVEHIVPAQQIQPTESKETPVEHIVPTQQIQPAESKETPVEHIVPSKVSENGHLEESSGNQETNNAPTEQVIPEEPPLENHVVDTDDLPIPPKKSYCLDFLDNLDDPNFNPFTTKTAVRLSPTASPEPGRKLPPLKPFVKKKKDTKNNSKQSEPPPADKSEPIAEKKAEEASEKPKADQLLEGTFEDSKPQIQAPPRPTRKSVPNKKPATKTPPKSKVIEKNNNRVDENTISETENRSEPEEDIPIPPSKGYNLDFLDNLDDPSFDPFSTKVTVSNSPPKEGFTVPNDQEIKPKTKVVPAKKSVAKKGFSVIKSKAKAAPEKAEERDPKSEKQDPPEVQNSVSSDKQSVEQSSNSPEEEDLPVPTKGYNLAFLDDPNFDPFKTSSSVDNQVNSATEEAPKTSRQVIGGPCTEEPKAVDESFQNTSEEVSEKLSQETEVTGKQTPEVSVPKVEERQETASSSSQVESAGNDVVDSVGGNKDSCDSTEVKVDQKEEGASAKEECIESKSALDVREETVLNDNIIVVNKVEQLETHKKTDLDSQSVEENTIPKNDVEENSIPKNDVEQLKVDDSKFQEKVLPSHADESDSFYEGDLRIPKSPSIGTIGHLDSLEFAQLLGNEASRLAEEFMNCSTDSGLPDSDDSVHLKPGNINSDMANRDLSTLARLSAHLDENVNPFQKTSRLQRSPPLGKRDMCGAEGGDSDSIDSFKPRRMLLRESGTGEDRLDTSSLDDDSGIALGSRSDLETDVNHSEAGPEIATGLTTSDLQCASQLKTEDQDDELFDQITDEEFLASEAFFKEATDIENQLRKSLATPPRGSQSKLSGDEVTPTKDKPEPSSSSTPEQQNKPVPSTSTPVPPHEERSAPEGTSSPTPRPSDTSERKSSSSRPNSIPSEGYMTATEVQKLLKQQELQFEEKLLRSELVSGEKEKKLRQAMKDEQKEMSTLGESVSELTQSRDALLKLVGQYKGMLASLVSEKEKEKQNQEERIKTLEQERNQALDDLANVEVAFSDVHRKYERTKQVVDTLRRNEETLRGAVTDYENKLQKQEQKFIEFQKHAEEKIQLANEEFEGIRRVNDQEMTKMGALLKKAEMKIMSLTDSNDRKTRENQELTQLCDDLINKVGTSH